MVAKKAFFHIFPQKTLIFPQKQLSYWDVAGRQPDPFKKASKAKPSLQDKNGQQARRASCPKSEQQARRASCERPASKAKPSLPQKASNKPAGRVASDPQARRSRARPKKRATSPRGELRATRKQGEAELAPKSEQPARRASCEPKRLTDTSAGLAGSKRADFGFRQGSETEVYECTRGRN